MSGNCTGTAGCTLTVGDGSTNCTKPGWYSNLQGKCVQGIVNEVAHSAHKT